MRLKILESHLHILDLLFHNLFWCSILFSKTPLLLTCAYCVTHSYDTLFEWTSCRICRTFHGNSRWRSKKYLVICLLRINFKYFERLRLGCLSMNSLSNVSLFILKILIVFSRLCPNQIRNCNFKYLLKSLINQTM